MKYGLSAQTLESLKSVFSNYGEIEQVILYGSRAMGTYREGSDIDLTIKSSSMDTTKLLQVENELEELMLPYKIDLSLFKQLDNPSLIDHIRRVGIVIF